MDQPTNGLNGLGSGVRQSQQQHSNGLSASSKTSIEAQTGRREHMYGRLGSQFTLADPSLFNRRVRIQQYTGTDSGFSILPKIVKSTTIFWFWALQFEDKKSTGKEIFLFWAL